jgi:hypothetical protein
MGSDDTFQAMATFRLEGENTLELIDIEGYAIGEEDTEGDTDAAEDAEKANALSAAQGAGSAASSEANMGGETPANPAGAPPAGAAGPAGPPNQNFISQMGERFRKATGRK